jgi:hypothetical protein
LLSNCYARDWGAFYRVLVVYYDIQAISPVHYLFWDVCIYIKKIHYTAGYLNA